MKGQILQFRKNFTQGVQKSPIFVLTYEGSFKKFKSFFGEIPKKSALYINEEQFKKVFVWGLKNNRFLYRYMRGKIFFQKMGGKNL